MIANLEALVSTDNDARLRAIIDHAVSLEEADDLDGAIGTYEEALLAGLATVEICYNLALLYKQQMLYEDALTLLEHCLDSPEYGASAHYASGECRLALSDLSGAAAHFDHAVRQIALDRIPDEQIAEVAHVFRVAIDTFTSLDDRERAATLASTLADFLEEHGDGEAAHFRSLTAVLRGTAADTEARQESAAQAAAGLTGSAQAGEAPVLPAAGDATFARPASGRPTTTGRLRTVYRRVTGLLVPDDGTGVPIGLSARGKSGLTGQLDARAVFEQGRVAGTGRVVWPPRRPVEVRLTIPLDGEAGQPADIRALLARSAEDLGQGRLEAVIDDCRCVIALAPEYTPIHLRLAETYARQGQLAEANAICKRLIQLHETSQDVLGALPAYRLLGAVEPDDLKPWTTMADLYFAHAPAADPGMVADIRALVLRAEATGAGEIALEYVERLIARRPDDPESVRLAARLQLRAGSAARALSHYQALLRADRQDPTAIAGANLALTLAAGTPHWPSLEALVGLLRGGAGSKTASGEDVLGLYEEILAMADAARRAPLHITAGLAALAASDTPAAIRHLGEGQRGASELPASAHFALAYGLQAAHEARGDAPAARQWLQRAAELLNDPEARQFAERTPLFGAHLSLGMLHAELADSLARGGQVDNALIVLEAAKADLPDDPAVRRSLARLLVRQGRLGQALDELDELSKRQLNAGQLDAMIETMREMSAMAGDNPAVKAILAERFLKRGCPDEALLELERIAAIHEGAGRTDKAAETLRQAADTAWMIGSHGRAYALYDRVLALAPDNVTLRQAYINCLLQGGRRDDAATQQRAIAATFWGARKVQETIAALHQVIVLDPRDAGSYAQLGEALSSVGEYAQAERVYRRLVRLTPDDPIIRAKQTAMAMLAREGKS